MLIVYRASAGSGKTYQLTGEYLKLLFDGNNSFRKILAVTFTNKATDEMKSRIIQELDILARRGKSGFLDSLMAHFSLTADQVYQKAHSLLLEILHDYSSFSISTIDRFFQQTMRAFAREIGLQGGYNVELDTNRLLSEAVDKMLFTLDDSQNEELLYWLLRFSTDKIENGKSWNFKKEIVDLGAELFKEKYLRMGSSMLAKLNDKDALTLYQKKLNELVVAFESGLKKIGNKALAVIAQNGFQIEDFSGGSRSPLKHFQLWAKGEVKMPTNTFLKLADNIDEWKPAGKNRQAEPAIKSAYANGLNDCVNESIAHFDLYPAYNSAIIIQKNIYTLGILSDIDSHIKSLIAENNLMLLSDTTHLLNKLIDGCDTPFIYEKIGTKIEHYMIDEFQDTSVMQWQNFSPLIHESISQIDPTSKKLSNLIVGDVKQSIYRWRSSDWKLLDEQLGIEFADTIEDKVLNENWRSGTAIVDFNNAFFTLCSDCLQQEFINEIPQSFTDNVVMNRYRSKIKDAYKDVYQYTPDQKRNDTGHVKIEWIDTGEYKEWEEEVLLRLPDVIAAWQDKGYSLRDMAVLVRTKNEGTRVADCLLKYKQNYPDSTRKFDVISDEALMIKNSPVIKLLIALLKHLRRPDDQELRRLALIEFAVCSTSKVNPIGEFFQNENEKERFEFSEAITAELIEIGKLPLYEMCERLIAVFIVDPTATDNLFLQAFQDIVLEFSSRKTSDLIAFLDWWSESGVKKSVSMPPSQDAIRIMTIHKSKGLGFKAVIIPFCDWSIDQKTGSLLWCEPKIEPFNELQLLPIPYSKSLSESIFAFDYFEEKLHAYIDNINLAYVAFTRAKEEMMIFAPKNEKVSISSLGGLIYQCVESGTISENDDRHFISLSDNFDENLLIYESGKEWVPKKSNEEKPNELQSINFRSINPDGRLHLKLRSVDFFAESQEQKYGKLMHDILSRISTHEDIQNAVSETVSQGEISSLEGVEIAQRISKWIDNPQAKVWFSPKKDLLNESTILLPDGSRYRPDRVMFLENGVEVVDFKFGQTKRNKYQKQVRQYMALIREMGFHNVKGYLWYVELEEVEEVLS